MSSTQHLNSWKRRLSTIVFVFVNINVSVISQLVDPAATVSPSTPTPSIPSLTTATPSPNIPLGPLSSLVPVAGTAAPTPTFGQLPIPGRTTASPTSAAVPIGTTEPPATGIPTAGTLAPGTTSIPLTVTTPSPAVTIGDPTVVTVSPTPVPLPTVEAVPTKSPTFAYGVTLEDCQADLISSDENGDGVLTQNEYALFLDSFGERFCRVPTGPSVIVLATWYVILIDLNITSTTTSTIPLTNMTMEHLQIVCGNTDRTINDACAEPTVSPQPSEAPSLPMPTPLPTSGSNSSAAPSISSAPIGASLVPTAPTTLAPTAPVPPSVPSTTAPSLVPAPSVPTPGRTTWPTFEQTTPTQKPTTASKGIPDVPFPSSARSVIRLTTTLMIIVVATTIVGLL